MIPPSAQRSGHEGRIGRLGRLIGTSTIVARPLCVCRSTLSGAVTMTQRFGAAKSAIGSLGRCSGAAPSSSRRSAARRTRSIRTSWSARSSPTGWRRSTPPRRPTSSWSTPAPSSRRPARSRSTPCWRSPTARPTAPSWWSPAAWRSATAPSWPRRCPRSTRWPASACRSPSAASPGAPPLPSFDLLNLPRPPAAAPWAYVKVAEGCDKACGFCAIPSFRGPQRSRSIDQILDRGGRSSRPAGVQEIVLVAQDLASYGRDQGVGHQGDRAAGGGGGGAGAVGAAALPVPVRAHAAARRRGARHRRAVLRPLAAARVRAAGAPHAPVGRRRPLPRAHRRHPHAGARRGLPLELHRRLPGRDRGRPRPAARLRRRRPARLVRVLRLLAGGRHLRRRPRRGGARGPRRRAAGRAAGAPGRHHRRPT